jgi:anaerobic magnesium-protoporphyrin IX monomethyl ester cyclase
MFKVGFISPGWENIGIEYLSACLKIKGIHTRLFFDPILFNESGFLDNKLLSNIFSYKNNILKEIIGYQPDLICFSVITDNYKWACKWSFDIKNHISVPILFGGIHPTSVPERVISNPLVDYVCIGEGEEAIVEIVEALKHKKPIGKIQNIYFKADGKIIKNDIRPLISDLNKLPFPDKELFYSALPIFQEGYAILTSRGCLFSCNYCNNNILKKIYGPSIFRRRNIENVIEELKQAKKEYKPKYICFFDDFFNAEKAWLKDFLVKYKQEINLPFNCYLYPDYVDENSVSEMKKAGCYRVELGLQIIDENKRTAVLGRNSSNKAIAYAIDLFKKSKIYVVCDTILGFPDENESDLINLAYFYNSHPPDHIETFWLRLYPKTEMTIWALENGYIDQKRNENIEEGYLNCGISGGGDTMNNLAKKFMIFFYIFLFLAPKYRLYILRKKIYMFFICPLPLPVIYMLIRFFRNPEFDFNVSRIKKKYAYFIFKKIPMNLLTKKL